MQPDPIECVAASITPMGAFQGELKGSAAPELGAAAIRAAVERARISPEEVQEVIMGCVLPAGQGQAPARQASLGAGLPLAAGCTTVNKMCGSGMKAAMFAHDLLACGANAIIDSIPPATMISFVPHARRSCADIAGFLPQPHILCTAGPPTPRGLLAP